MIEALGDPYLQWCRAAVAELSGIPALLAMLDADEFDGESDGEEPEPPPLQPEVLDSVLDKVKWRRHRSRWMTSAAVGLAAAVLAAGVVIAIRPGAVGLQNGTPEVTAATYEMTKLTPTPFNATVSGSDFGWGTRIDMARTYGQWSGGGPAAPPSRLGMVVVGRDGTRSEIATWLGLSGATALPSGNTTLHRDDIAAVQLVSADTHEVLLEKTL